MSERVLTRSEMDEDLRQLLDVCKRCWAYEEHHRNKLGIELEKLHETAAKSIDASTTASDFQRIVERFLQAMQDGHVRIPGSYYAIGKNNERVLSRGWPLGRSPRPPSWRILDDDLGFLEITSFGAASAWVPGLSLAAEAGEIPPVETIIQSARSILDAAFLALKDTRALILDLRGNAGGYEAIVRLLLGHLLNKDAPHLTIQRRISREYIVARGGSFESDSGWDERRSEDVRSLAHRDPPGQHLASEKKPLVVIIDGISSSCTLNLVVSLRHHRRESVRVVGRPSLSTAGDGMELTTLVHSGLPIGLSTMLVWGPDGEIMEGRIVAPDVLVTEPAEADPAVDKDVEAATRVARGLVAGS